jgi:hypothetical protein
VTIMIVVSDLCGRADASFQPIKLYVSNSGIYSSNWYLFLAGTKPNKNTVLTLRKIISCLVDFHLKATYKDTIFCLVILRLASKLKLRILTRLLNYICLLLYA